MYKNPIWFQISTEICMIYRMMLDVGLHAPHTLEQSWSRGAIAPKPRDEP